MPDTDDTLERPRGRWRAAFLFTPLVGLTAIGITADISAPSLIGSYPLLLIAMSPRNRYLALAAPNVHFLPFLLIGMARQLLSDPIFYVIGRRYGDRAINWLETRAGVGTSITTTWVRWFDRAGYPMVAIAPNNVICMLAGVRNMPIALFLICNLGGTAARIVIIFVFGDIFSDPISSVVDAIDRYRWWLTGASFAFIAVHLWIGRRRGTPELESPFTMERELEGEGDTDSSTQ